MGPKTELNTYVPDVVSVAKNWEDGNVLCTECKQPVALNKELCLQIQKCPLCGKPFFVLKKVGKYFLYEPCGSGGMGSVYKALKMNDPDNVFAVKVLSREMRENPGDIYALLNEARIGTNFAKSEFIAACIDYGFDDDEYYVVMRFVPGERLDKLLSRIHKMPEKPAIQMALHILAAEQHIYKKGFLFRDLKPENIIISPDGYAVLIDFGLCITCEQAKTCLDEFVSGSPYYLPPERLLGTGESVCSELYSLGMVLYEALTGKTYFDSGEIESLARRHVSNLRISNTAKMKGLRPSVGALLESLIRKQPENRPQTFKEVADAVKAILAEMG
ncbi:MAG: serine/threonine-protein kinase [Lentisphaeria bacterium]